MRSPWPRSNPLTVLLFKSELCDSNELCNRLNCQFKKILIILEALNFNFRLPSHNGRQLHVDVTCLPNPQFSLLSEIKGNLKLDLFQKKVYDLEGPLMLSELRLVNSLGFKIKEAKMTASRVNDIFTNPNELPSVFFTFREPSTETNRALLNLLNRIVIQNPYSTPKDATNKIQEAVHSKNLNFLVRLACIKKEFLPLLVFLLIFRSELSLNLQDKGPTSGRTALDVAKDNNNPDATECLNKVLGF